MSKAEKTDKRDALVQIETLMQGLWNTVKANQADMPDEKDQREKFFATFPYPYMNGVLHLGHAFTLAKAEFAARYQGLQGKNVLWPFAFHCTGMPISACADKLKREVETFGNPPIFNVVEESDEPVKEVKKEVKLEGKRKTKGKLAGKKSKMKYQWQIMQEMGLGQNEDIADFQDAEHWLHYFPPIAQRDLQKMGVAVDWRRSFITTDVNPYYDAFIQWQFRTLYRKNRVTFGNRAAIFSPADNQTCADHDRSTGEGVKPQEYTCIKLELLEVPAELKSMVKPNQKVFLPAATLRPETMYGQTNLFVLPEGDYGVYEYHNGAELYVQSDRSAMNMAYQNMTEVRGQPVLRGRIQGASLIGSPVKAPLATYERVYILPLLTIKMDKGTGVVTSVPSDAPDDWAALTDLKKKQPFREKYGLTDEQVLPFEIVSIIDIPGLGTQAAADLCVKNKVKSQADKEKLALIKDQCYLEGFTKGVMLVGKYKGTAVKDAKPLIQKMLCDSNEAFLYQEPDGPVTARSGGECVVAFTDQWFLEYGNPGWKEMVMQHVKETLNTFDGRTSGQPAKNAFIATVSKLHEWGCSRTYGLGTKLPWDKKWLIESLSDSTIYFAYYTIAHYLQGNVDGSQRPNTGIKPEDLTDDVFNFIFLRKEFPDLPESTIKPALLEKMRAEFEYWYPMDLRVSGKDLIYNHLTFSMFAHAAVWDQQPEYWPRAFFSNGHLMIDGNKMSKSTGNFLTLSAALDKYGTDATRIALAASGDALEDANFESSNANAAIMKLSRELEYIRDVQTDTTLRTGDYGLFDKIFDNEMNKCIHNAKAAYDNMQYLLAVTHGYHGLSKARDQYRASVEVGHSDLLNKYIESWLIVCFPLIPHYCDFVYSQVLRNESTGYLATDGRWPEAPAEDTVLSAQADYLRSVEKEIRATAQKKQELELKKATKEKREPAQFDTVDIYLANGLPDHYRKTLDAAFSEYNKNGALPGNREIAGLLNTAGVAKKDIKLAMSFFAMVQAGFNERGAAALSSDTLFDEETFIEEHFARIKDACAQGNSSVTNFNIIPYDNTGATPKPKVGAREADAQPGKPMFHYYKAAPKPAPEAAPAATSSSKKSSKKKSKRRSKK